jgi:hypothetical protein
MDVACVGRTERSMSSVQNSMHHVGFNATRYDSHVRSDETKIEDPVCPTRRWHRASTVDYAVQCLNDDEAPKLPGVEIALPAAVVGAHVRDRGWPTWPN